MRVEERQGQTSATADQILGEIREFCRATQTAESTFGRIVVNDGKLVSRLRDGARITTGTLDKVRAYLSEHRAAAPVAQDRRLQTVKPVNGAVAPGRVSLLRQPAKIPAVRVDLQREDRDRQPDLAGA